MFRTMFKSKIHMATVTQTELLYTGSITIPADLIEQADLLPGEKVQVVNKNNGVRLETYVLEGPRGSKQFCLNGPAARLGRPGDRVVIISYAIMTEEEARTRKPVVLVMNPDNTIASIQDK